MDKTQMTFESALKRLDEIVALLENPRTPLETSMSLFEEAVTLSKYCQSVLATVEDKVGVLLGGKTENFDENND